MLIDKHTVKIIGSKWDHKKDKRIQDQINQLIIELKGGVI